MSEKTFTESEIRQAVLTYHEGCSDGKITFLSEAFDIEAQCEQYITMTVRVKVPTFDNCGTLIDAETVDGAVESTLDSYLYEALDVANDGTIDARGSGAHVA